MARFVAALLALLALISTLQAQDASQLCVGHWIRAKGALESPGVFAAGEIEVVQPENSESLTGSVTAALEGGAFSLLGVRVATDARTTFEGVSAKALAGVRVKVSGRLRPGGEFLARRVSARDPGRDRVEGRIEAIEGAGESLELRVLDLEVRVAVRSKLELDRPLAALKLAPARDAAIETPARDEDDLVRGSIILGDDWVLGGLVEYDSENRGNFDLDDSRARDRTEHYLSLRTELVWTPSDSALFLASYEHTEDWRQEQNKPDLQKSDGQFKQAYGYFRELFFGWDLQVGRAEYHESRRWLYNTELDGVRLLRTWQGLHFDLAVTTKLADGSTRDENSTNLMAYVGGGTPKRGWALWGIDRDNREVASEHTQHYGARLLGEWLPATDVWGEASLLRGDSAGKNVSASAFDVGATWSPDLLGPFSVIGGYAFAAGDSTPLDSDSSTYRQTGFQDNKGKLASATSLKYYGELLDPELSNLGILTLGVGVKLEKHTTLSLLAHQYTLDHAQDALYGSNLRGTTDGVHPQLGWEYDLVFGTKRWTSWQVEFVLGMFEPGAAFPGGDSAYLGALQVKYRF